MRSGRIVWASRKTRVLPVSCPCRWSRREAREFLALEGRIVRTRRQNSSSGSGPSIWDRTCTTAWLRDTSGAATRTQGDADLVGFVLTAFHLGLELLAPAHQVYDGAAVIVLLPPPVRLRRGVLPNDRCGQLCGLARGLNSENVLARVRGRSPDYSAV